MNNFKQHLLIVQHIAEAIGAQQQKLAEVNNKLQLAIQAVGREGGYICVFDIASGIPYISETLCDDLNAKVKAKLGIIK